jgi:hypothetical protein
VTVGQGQPEIEKVRLAWVQQKAIDWERVHRLPDHTRFVHEAHIQAGIACATCHGDVDRMPQVHKVQQVDRMGFCITCHVERNVSRDCSVCHY